MGFIDRIRLSRLQERLFEEWLYEQALDELDQGRRRRGLWAKALAEAAGDETRARGEYLRLHVQAMKDDATALESYAEVFNRSGSTRESKGARRKDADARPVTDVSAEFEVWLSRQGLTQHMLGAEDTREYRRAFEHRLHSGEITLNDFK